MWFPLGQAEIGGSTFGIANHYGSLWTCIFNRGIGNAGFLIPSDLETTWNLGGKAGYRYRAMGAL